MKNELLVVHIDRQPKNVQFWRLAVLNDEEVKRIILNEYQIVLYIARPGVQHNGDKLRQKFC